MNNKTITAQERKNRSIEILQTQNVPFIEHLPLRYETNEVIPREIFFRLDTVPLTCLLPRNKK